MPEGDPIVELLQLAQRLPVAAVALFRRYGKPLAIELPEESPRVELLLSDGSTLTLAALRVRTPVDVIANDWFVLALPNEDVLAVPGPLFAAAMAALAQKR